MSVDLDIQVAKAMGWRHVDLGKFGLWNFTGIKLWKHPDGSAHYYLPPYSTNMSTVWHVVEYARSQMLVLKLYQAVPSDEWVATFYEHTSIRRGPGPASLGYKEYASTASEAICLAFLKAVEGMKLARQEGS